MKKFRKLIPALCMLLVSALFVGTSTYAWFSMNTSVTATNMQVTAKSDNIYLQIKQDSNLTYATTDAAKSVAKSLYPVDYKTVEDGAVTWGRTTSDDTNSVNYTAKASLQDVTDNANYVWSDKFQIKVADAQAQAKNLKLTNVTVKSGVDSEMSEALRVLVVTNEGAMLWGNTGAKVNNVDATGISVVDGTNLAATVTNTAIDVTVYIYFDGNDSSCYTNGIIESFKQMEIELTFGASAPSEA